MGKRIAAHILLCGALVGGLAGPGFARSPSPPAPSRPHWILYPKSDDSAFLYRIGQATDRPSPEAARSAAYQNALEALSREILSTLKVEGDTTALSSRMQIRGAEVMAQAVHVEQGPGGFSCWLQVSYPRAERNKALEDVAAGREMDGLWASAQAAFHRGEFSVAQEKIQTLLKHGGSREYISFDLDDARKMLGDAYRLQKNYLQARHWYEQVAQLSESDAHRGAAQQEIRRLPDPPMMWPMRDRWRNRTVGLVCARRSEDRLESFGALIRVFRKELQQAEMTSVDLGLTAERMMELFDVDDLSFLEEDAGPAGVVLAVLYDVQQPAAGGSGIDTVVQYLVVDAARRAIVDRGQFKEMTGTQSPDRMAARCAEILARRYLVPRSPALAEGRE